VRADKLDIVVLGLSLSSSWGNGHATTYRALLKAFAAQGHDVLFLERDVPWYAAHRDLERPDYCALEFYSDLRSLERYRPEIARADAVVVGSYVPEGVAVGRFVQSHAGGVTAFYDIDTPVTLAKIDQGDHEYLSPDLIPGFDLYLSFTGGPTLRRIEECYGSPAARALYCSSIPPPTRRSRERSVGTSAISAPTAPTVSRRSRAARSSRRGARRICASWWPGPQYPGDIAWPANVERIEHVPPRDHAEFYASCRFTLNVTRADMIRPATARACACSRQPRPTRRSSRMFGPASTRSCARAARSSRRATPTTSWPC
jgi:spore maturation protein CgeB